MGFPIKFGPKTGSNSGRKLVMLKNQSKFLNCDRKKSCFTRGVIFEANSRIMVFTFVKREFKDFAFHKCEVSVSGKKRKVLGKSKNNEVSSYAPNASRGTSHFSNARYSI